MIFPPFLTSIEIVFLFERMSSYSILIKRLFCDKIIQGDIMIEKKKRVTNCETCENYVYDEQYDSYYCDMNLDEDEMMHFLTGNFGNCPYYRENDEYRIVRRQN